MNPFLQGDPFLHVPAGVSERALRRARERVAPKLRSRLLVVAFAAIASSAALAAVERLTAKPAVVAPVVRVVPAPVVVPTAPLPVPVPTVKPALKPRLAPHAAPVKVETTLDAEAQLLLRALHQLRAENAPAAALATLDAHDSKFPHGALAKEAAEARTEAQERLKERSP